MKSILAYMFLCTALVHSALCSPKIIIANNMRITYDYGSNVKPYVANEVKIVDDGTNTTFVANKFRFGFRYKLSDQVRLDPHIFVDNKLKDNWIPIPGPAIRIDITY
jgi:hypothetical protein